MPERTDTTQSQPFASAHEGKPWEHLLVRLWSSGTSGRRKYVVVPLFLIFVFVPAVASFFQSYSALSQIVADALRSRTTLLSSAERDVLDEWVIQLAVVASKEEAVELRTEFMQAYLPVETIRDSGVALYAKDIFTVRDPRKHGRWMVVIDPAPGASDRPEVQRRLDRLLTLAGSDRNVANSLGHFLNGSAPFLYSRGLLVSNYGRIEQ